MSSASTATAPSEPVRPSAAGPAHAPGPQPVSLDAARARKAGGRKRILLAVVAVLVVAALVYGARTVLYARAHESTDNAQVDGHIVPVIAKVGGYVQAVNVVENQAVKEGAPLVRIDDAEYRVRLAEREADLRAAEATAGTGGQLGQAEAQVRTATSQQAVGQAQVAAARASLERAEADYRRYQQLAQQQIISQQNLDAARAAVDVARANLTAVERQVSAAGAGIVNAEAGVRLASARVASAKAQRDNAALQLSYTNVTAPASGVVSKKSVEIGQLVQPGQTLMSVVADTGVWVTANFKETQLRDIRVGQPVEMEIDAYDGAKVEGTVESIGSATGAKFALLPPDNATGNFTKVVQRVPVRIRIVRGLDRQRPLRPGMSVEAHVRTN